MIERMTKVRRNISTPTLMFLFLILCILGCKQFGPGPKWPKSKKLSDKEDHPQKILSDGAYVYFVTGGTIASKNEHTNNIKRIRIADGSVSIVVAGAIASQMMRLRWMTNTFTGRTVPTFYVCRKRADKTRS